MISQAYDETTRARDTILGVCLRFEECGCCRADFIGDCRDNAHRFTADQLDAMYPGVWVAFDLEDQCDDT